MEWVCVLVHEQNSIDWVSSAVLLKYKQVKRIDFPNKYCLTQVRAIQSDNRRAPDPIPGDWACVWNTVCPVVCKEQELWRLQKTKPLCLLKRWDNYVPKALPSSLLKLVICFLVAQQWPLGITQKLWAPSLFSASVSPAQSGKVQENWLMFT